ncbi:MAG: transcriptional repressor [Chloroflexi bacterium]|nr:transcriptional repressor [Chloroflexota bacterium]
MGRFSQVLRDRGYRITVQREVILDEVEALPGHVSPNDVHARVAARFPQVNVTTVYRTLELLEHEGLVSHMHFHDGARWHRADEGLHQHLVCRQCGLEEQVELDEMQPLARELLSRHGFHADLAHFAIVGVCQECVRAAAVPVG